LLWNRGPDNQPNQAFIFDPVGGAPLQRLDPPFRGLGNPGNNLFCSGHTLLEDGRVLVAGGHLQYPNQGPYPPNSRIGEGLAYTNLFNPSGSGSWASSLPNMSHARWYPTTTMLPSGEVAVVGGTDETGTFMWQVEIWSPANSTWRVLTGTDWARPYYAWYFVDPKPGNEGQLFEVGPDAWNCSLHTDGIGQFTSDGVNRYNQGMYEGLREYGSAVTYGNGKVMVVGGGQTQPTATAETLDLYATPRQWQSATPMNFTRKYLNTVALPDGTVLAVGGTSGSCSDEGAEGQNGLPDYAVRPAELWTPATNAWTVVASLNEARLYHSVALLLPDARVFVAGGGQGGGCGSSAFEDHENFEIYTPPYLYRLGARPSIYWAPDTVGYNQDLSFWMNDGSANVNSVTLIRLPSVTHSFNQNQGYVSLPVTYRDENWQARVHTPARWEELAPGHYMMFALNAQNVPSVAKIIRVVR